MKRLLSARAEAQAGLVSRDVVGVQHEVICRNARRFSGADHRLTFAQELVQGKTGLRCRNVRARRDFDTKSALDASDDARFAGLVAEREHRARLWPGRVYFGWEIAR